MPTSTKQLAIHGGRPLLQRHHPAEHLQGRFPLVLNEVFSAARKILLKINHYQDIRIKTEA